jgi:4-hydroxy-4-methyl-2-oxoglutarate aldolase
MIQPNDPRLDAVASASLTDAIGRRYEHRAHILDLISPVRGRRLFGPAVTLQFMPVRSDIRDAATHGFARCLYDAVGDHAAGKVLVISSCCHHRTSVGGGTKLSRLQHLKMAGVLTDGRLRDFDALASYDFAVYCAGETSHVGGDTLMPMAIQRPVAVSGVTVVPGDYVFADAGGAVVVPARDIDWALDEAVRIEDEDRRDLTEIAREDPRDLRKQGDNES